MAGYAFPFNETFELVLSCFTGSVPSKVNGLQQKLQRVDVSARTKGPQPVKDLTNLEAQSWMYETVLAQLGADPSVNHEKISKTIEAIENKRKEVLEELEPRRLQSHRIFSNLQDNTRELFAGQAEKDYEHLDKIVTNLILHTRSRQPSQIVLSEVIKKLSIEIAQNSNLISPYRLRLAYKLDALMRDISSRLVLDSTDFNTDGNYQAVIDELNSEINLLSRQFSKLLVSRQNSKDRERQYEQDNSILGYNVRELHKTLAQLNREKKNLQEKIQDDSRYDRKRDLEAARLNQEIYRWSSAYTELKEQQTRQHQQEAQRQQAQRRQVQQQTELTKKYNELCQLYQQKLNEVAGLNHQITYLMANQIKSQPADRNQTNTPFSPLRSLSQYSRPAADKKIAKTRSKESTLTPEEWSKIHNQSDYIRVKSHTKKDGTFVRGHYRRRRRSR